MNKNFVAVMIAVWSVIALALVGLLVFLMCFGRGFLHGFNGWAYKDNVSNGFNFGDWNWDNKYSSGKKAQIVNKSFDSSGISKISTNAALADVSFSKSKDDKIKVVITGNNRKYYTYSVSKDGSVLQITQKHKDWSWSSLFGSNNQHISITLPQSYKKDLSINVATGDISFNGDYTFKNADITNTTSDITGGSIKADYFTLKTVTGDIDLSKIDANYDISVTTGDFKVMTLNGCGSINTITGDITANIKKLTGTLNVSVITGDSTIGLSKDINADISAKAVGGDINSSDFPMQYSGRDRNNATAQIGKAPYNNINVSAVTGDVNLNQD